MDDKLRQLKEQNEKKANTDLSVKMHNQKIQVEMDLQKVIFDSMQDLIGVMQGNATKGEAISRIVTALDKLEDKVEEKNKDTETELGVLKAGLETLQKELSAVPTNSLKQLPKFLQQREEIKVNNLGELIKAVDEVKTAISKQNLSVKAPDVKVAAPNVTVAPTPISIPKTDFNPLLSAMTDVISAVQNIEIPEVPFTDLTKLEKNSDKSLKLLEAIRDRPIAGGGSSGGGGGKSAFKDSTGSTALADVILSNGKNALAVVNPDGSNISAGGGSNSTQYQEGSLVTPATGNYILGRYSSTLPTLIDGQMAPLQMDTRGGLQTVITDSNGTGAATVGSAGNNVLTNTNGLHSNSRMYLQFDDTSTTILTEDRLGILRGSANRNLYTTLRDAAGNERGVNVLGGDTEQNALLIAGNRKEVSFSTTTVQAVGSTDVSNYKWVSIHVLTQGTSSVITFQGSNDNTNWTTVNLQNIANVTSATSGTATTANVIYYGSINFRYFRLNVTGISAGTTSGVMEFSSVAGSYHSIGMNGVVNTASATGTAVPANAFYWGINGTSGQLTGVVAAGIQTDATTGNSILPGGNFLYNNASWDKQRNNVYVTLATSAARTTAFASADQLNHNWRGAQVILSVTTASGTGGLQVQIQGKANVPTAYFQLNNNPTAVTTTGTYVYELYQGASGTATGGVTQRTDGILPRNFRVNVAVSDASSYTYSLEVLGVV